MAIDDLNKGEVSNYLQLILLGNFILKKIKLEWLIITLILYFLCYQSVKVWENFIGGADIKILLTLFYELETEIITLLFVSSLIGIAVMSILKVGKLRFIPIIVLSYYGMIFIR